ncbi:hypothetical protein AK812_SmicGene4749 [Symbiodinium microadriaticum]|uniref:Uncharacterized protein n=1 Tax=Symbiodinium microadriaticum TaxID=2951 RepID=A0A1Q9EVI7_SYMMI|nr:hypothetical protein AK812_SmicGene4749 [Symbiodinium microadriaticum]
MDIAGAFREWLAKGDDQWQGGSAKRVHAGSDPQELLRNLARERLDQDVQTALENFKRNLKENIRYIGQDDGKGWFWLVAGQNPGGLYLYVMKSPPYGERPLALIRESNIDEFFEKVNWHILFVRLHKWNLWGGKAQAPFGQGRQKVTRGCDTHPAKKDFLKHDSFHFHSHTKCYVIHGFGAKGSIGETIIYKERPPSLAASPPGWRNENDEDDEEDDVEVYFLVAAPWFIGWWGFQLGVPDIKARYVDMFVFFVIRNETFELCSGFDWA